MFLREDEVGRRVARHLEPGWTVLDYGAGTGLLARYLTRRVGIRPTLADLVDYRNRLPDFPFLEMGDPFHVPVEGFAFDAVLLLFALHHNPWEAQPKVLAEASRLFTRRLVVVEDTPFGMLDRLANTAWDKALNLRHGVPTPFTFRGVGEWLEAFADHGLRAVHVESYRPLWPTLGTYHHTLFVLEREGSGAVPRRPAAE